MVAVVLVDSVVVETASGNVVELAKAVVADERCVVAVGRVVVVCSPTVTTVRAADVSTVARPPPEHAAVTTATAATVRR